MGGSSSGGKQDSRVGLILVRRRYYCVYVRGYVLVSVQNDIRWCIKWY